MVSQEPTEKSLEESASYRKVVSQSEAEVTHIVFVGALKDLLYFIPVGIVIFVVTKNYDLIEKIVGWIGVVVFGLFALYFLFTLGMTLVTLVATPIFDKIAPAKNTFWLFVQSLITFGNFAVYSSLAFLVYAGMYKLDIQQFLP